MRRCLIHVGAPKTGTTYLQHVLWHNQQTLAHRGLLYPGSMTSAHHDAALDLRGVSFGKGVQTRPVEAWDRMVAEVREWQGDAIVSSELLAWATRAQVERAMGSFPDHEVHIIFTARDLGRQIPAVWQEEVKNRRVLSFEKFLDRLDTGDDRDTGPGNIWGGQDPRLVLGAWAAFVPASQVRIVTVPPGGAPSGTLLERFCAVLRVDTDGLDISAGGANIGLGAAQAELLRQVNRRLDTEFSWQSYDRLVKHGIALGPLAKGGGKQKVGLPRHVLPMVTARTERILAAVVEAGYDVVGDLADLSVTESAVTESAVTEKADDSEAASAALLEAGSATIAHLLDRLAKSRLEVAALAQDLAEARSGPVVAPPAGVLEAPAARPAPAPGPTPLLKPSPARPRHNPRRSGQHAVFVFVGPPKVGLDRLPDILGANRRRLQSMGVKMPGDRAAVRRAAAELTAPGFAEVADAEGEGAWAELAAEVRDSGTWLIAHDLLAGASAESAQAAVAALAPAEVHVVTVARSVDRQLPAEWLEQLRNGGRQAFEHFLTDAVGDSDVEPHRTWFWQTQDIAVVLSRWAAAKVPADRVHVVTAPAEPDQTTRTWQRLCAVLGVDPAGLALPADVVPLEPRAADAEVMRQVNLALAGQAWALPRKQGYAGGRPTADYERVVRRTLLDDLLASHPEGMVLALPPALHGWAQARASATAAALADAGYDVVGDLSDLRPGPVRDDLVQPGRVPDQQLLDAAVQLIARVSERLAAGPDGMGTRQLTGYLAERVRERARHRLRRQR